MTQRKKVDPKRADRFVSSEAGFKLHRNPGQAPVPGLPNQTTRPARSRGEQKLGLGTLRRERRLTQVELAKKIGIGQDEVSRIENGKDPKLSTVLKYLEGLEVAKVQLAVIYPDGKEATLPLRSAANAKAR